MREGGWGGEGGPAAQPGAANLVAGTVWHVLVCWLRPLALRLPLPPAPSARRSGLLWSVTLPAGGCVWWWPR